MAWQQFRDLQQGEFIIMFADYSMGGIDNTAVQCLSHKWLDVPLVYHEHMTGSYVTPLIHEKLIQIGKQTGVKPIVAFERNNGGAYEMDRLARLNRYGDYTIYTAHTIDPTGRSIDSGKLGYDTNLATRPKMLQELKEAIESGLLHLYHRQTVQEMFSFVVKENGKAQAENGAHDDLVMSLAGVWQLYQTEKPPTYEDSGVVETQGSVHYKEAGVLIAGEQYE